MKIIEPKIKNLINYDIENASIEEDFNNYIFDKYDKETNIKNITIDSCIFNKIDFSNINIENVDLVDVIFDGCDLSNKIFDNKLVTRVIFKNCKMIGTSFETSSLKDVKFIDCNSRYLNFYNAKINN